MKALLGGMIVSSLIVGQAAAFENHYANVEAFNEFSNRSAGYAGVYLNINLSTSPQSKSKMLSYGFRAGLQQSQNPQSWSTNLTDRHRVINLNKSVQYGPSRPQNIDIFKIGFSEDGFEKSDVLGATMFAANGNETFWDIAAKADDDGGGGIGTGWLIGGGVVLGLVGVIALTANAIENDLEDFGQN